MTHQEIKEENLRKAKHHAEELKLLCQDPDIAVAIANNFWDEDDSEAHHQEAYEIADNIGVENEIGVMCAMSLPSFTVTGHAPSEEDGDNTYTYGKRK